MFSEQPRVSLSTLKIMTCPGTRLIRVFAGLMLCTAASAQNDAESRANPYQSIVDRNLFALKPPPPPPEPESLKPPMPKFYLTGITTMLGRKRALMKAMPKAKPGVQPKEQSYFMAEGQRDGELEVLKIDEVARTVKVDYAGTMVVLDFTNNAVKGSASPLAGFPPVPPPRGGVPTFGYPGSNPGFRQPAVPTRPLRRTAGTSMRSPPSAGAAMGSAPVFLARLAPAETVRARGAAPFAAQEMKT
jgi:hypothetical protein